MVLEPVDPNEHFRERRRRRRRQVRIRRAVALAVLVGVAAGAGALLRLVGDEAGRAAVEAQTPAKPAKAAPAKPRADGPRPAPLEMRGVHVTMALASIPGKLEEYMRIAGLNTVQLDIKDENGEIGFSEGMPKLAKDVGAARDYYVGEDAVALARKHGVYLVGRVVCFEDPVLSSQRIDRAVQRRDGTRWTNHAGLGWSDPYNRENWDYLGDIAEAGAKAGFDEIQLDYVRFPTDGDIDDMVFPAKTATPMGWTIAEFVHYMRKRLKPYGVRLSADVFGLAATHDLGIGQVPRRISRYLDAIYPMVYPSHYNSGEYNLPDPAAAPYETVKASLADFKRELAGRKTVIIPWLQDFSYGRTYTADDVRAQIDAAREMGTGGFLLWNAAGVYTTEVMTYESPAG